MRDTRDLRIYMEREFRGKVEKHTQRLAFPQTLGPITRIEVIEIGSGETPRQDKVLNTFLPVGDARTGIERLKWHRTLLKVARELRVIGNRLDIPYPIAKWLNIIGKDVELLEAELSAIIEFLEEGKKPSKEQVEALSEHARIKPLIMERLRKFVEEK